MSRETPAEAGSGPLAGQPAGAFTRALASVDPDTQQALRDLVSDTAYVSPRVVSHVQR